MHDIRAHTIMHAAGTVERASAHETRFMAWQRTSSIINNESSAIQQLSLLMDGEREIGMKREDMRTGLLMGSAEWGRGRS